MTGRRKHAGGLGSDERGRSASDAERVLHNPTYQIGEGSCHLEAWGRCSAGTRAMALP